MRRFSYHLSCTLILVAGLVIVALAQPVPPPVTPELSIVKGVVKEVNPARKSITFLKTVEGAYGPQRVTDVMFLHPEATITLNGMKMPLKDIRPGDSVVFECLPKPERALRIAALSPEQLEKLQKEKDQIKKFEQKVEADHLRLIKELARKELVKDFERAKEKAKAAEAKMKAEIEKKSGEADPNAPPKKEPPKKDEPKNPPPYGGS